MWSYFKLQTKLYLIEKQGYTVSKDQLGEEILKFTFEVLNDF